MAMCQDCEKEHEDDHIGKVCKKCKRGIVHADFRVCDITGEMMTEGWLFEGSGQYVKYEKDVNKILRDNLDALIIDFMDAQSVVVPVGVMDRIKNDTLTDDDLREIAYACDWAFWTEWS